MTRRTFGRADRRVDWRLREEIAYRRTARRVAVICGGVVAVAAIGLHFARASGNGGGVALCSLIAFLAGIVGVVAVNEA